MDRKISKRRVIGAVSSHAHPIVAELLAIAGKKGIGERELARKAGIYSQSCWEWRVGRSPNLFNLSCTLSVLGYELAIRPKALE